MPVRIRWKSKEYAGIGLLLLGICGIFQLLTTFIGQYFLGIGNYYVVYLIPLGIWAAIFYATLIIFESYTQIARREKLHSQFRKLGEKNLKLQKFLNFPITKPLLIIFILFNAFFFSSFFICTLIFDNTMAFLIAENISAIACLLGASFIEQNYGRIQRY